MKSIIKGSRSSRSKSRRSSAAWALLAFWAIWAPAVLAQSSTSSLEIGWRYLDPDGNEDVYRTQENENQGLLLRSFHFDQLMSEEVQWLDRVRVDASGFGGSPQGEVRVKAEASQYFRLDLRYTRLEHYSALPGFANPFLNEEVIPGQHTVDRVRKRVDMEIVLLPEGNFQPFLAYSHQDYEGPARTTYHLGGDEFRLDSALDETETDLRVGLRFKSGSVDGEVVQGWRNLRADENRSLQANAGGGNHDTTVLGLDPTLDQYGSQTRTEVDTPVTTAFVRGNLLDSRVSWLADYQYAGSESDVREDDLFSGELVSFEIRRFFGGGTESVRSQTESPSWRAGLRAEAQLPGSLELSLGYVRRDRKLDGNALLSTLFLDSVTFGGIDGRDYERVIDARTHLEKDENLFDARLAATGIQHWTFWVSWSQSNEDTIISQDLAEIVLPQGQMGEFDRSVESLSLGAAFRRGKTRLTAEWRDQDGDSAVVRTDFLSRTSIEIKGRSGLGKWLTYDGSAKWVSSENPSAAIAYDSDSFQMGFNAEMALLKGFWLRAGYGLFNFESTVDYRRPDFNPETSFHEEDGQVTSGGCRWTHGDWTLAADYADYANDGVLPFHLERSGLRADYAFTLKLKASVEWSRRRYREEQLRLANYEAEGLALLLNLNF